LEKVRVYELAKELNTTSKRLMEKLAEININVKNHMSLLDKQELEALYNHIGVIRHDDKADDAEEKKAAPAIPAPPRPEVKKNARKAPRIIRTTEIIINTRDEGRDSPRDGYRKGDVRGDRYDRKSEYVRTADANTGLLAGFVRKTKPDYMININEIKKQERKKKAAETPAKEGGTPSATDSAKKPAVKGEAREPAVKETAKVQAEKVRTEPLKEPKVSTAATDAAKKDEKKEAAREQVAAKPAGGAEERKVAAKQPSAETKTARLQEEKPREDVVQEEKLKSAKPQAGKPQQQGAGRPQGGQGYRQTVKPLDIPKPDPAIVQKEERSESRREYAGKGLERDARREQKKEISRTQQGKPSKKIKPTNIGLAGKKGVSEILSEDFIFNELYEETELKKKRPGRPRKGKSQPQKHIPPKAVLTSIKIPESITVKELAEALKKTSSEVIKKLMGYGVMATLNQEIDYDTAAIIADEFGVKAEKEVVITEEDILFDDSEQDDPDKLVPRPPVVVVMGHVDHGKTSLLDAIRSTNVIESEAGGITQHIGAYMVKVKNRNITFLDTPGHEAFTAMRARGAQVTDIAILVVAADDGVMPQTVEAINHAKAANVSIIVAINKIDKPGANPDKVKQELMQHGLVPEEWGGDVICVNVSAKKRENIDQLLEMVLLTADILELKANPDRQAKGTVIEAKLDKNRGPLATVMVQRGTLKVGDSIVTGTTVGRIRAMINDRGVQVKNAGPSTPVEILGLPEVPEAGEVFYAIEDEKTAKQLVEKRRMKLKEQQLNAAPKVSLDELFNQIQKGEVKELNVIVKADVQGSVEAVEQSLEKLSNEEVRIKVIHGGVGAITESDVTLADVSNAIIIGFNVRPGANVTDMAKSAGVDIRLYRVIYDAIEDVEAAMKGMLEPKFKEVVLGHTEVRQIFKISGIGTVAGCYVLDGKITRNSDIRVVRDGVVIYEGKLASLKRFKDDVKEVLQGYECGLSIEKFNDIKMQDIIEAFTMEEVEE
jgi:translation initiation factor IF-2